MNQTAQDFFIRGMASCQGENYSEAIAFFSQALSIDSGHTEALYNRAKSRFKLRKFEEALGDFSKLIEQEPQNAFYFSERAVAYHLSGDNKKALEDLDQAVILEPNKPFRYSSRAFIRERAGDLKGAIEDYEKTIALDPEDAIAFNNKGLVEEKLGYKEKALKSFENADRLDPAYDHEKAKKHDPPKPKPATNIKKPEPVEQAGYREKLTLTGYLRLVKRIVTTKSERKEFRSFLKGILKKKT
ncbi:tetratricopeptide repeat protein [Fulvivirga ulvae]|uniref:tetratricopeptide repeat protein n=1 Tax=Fulvivirga ulvae TaxID=2904245 RepID=UPI001F37C4F6|nr:tetratricopeptide repeat protein [Fulvivirga ulvae]UII30951.1 tetratricopeptide repeat protein [Fulvivirga ulvae]